VKCTIPRDAVKIESLRIKVIEQPELVIGELFSVMKPDSDRKKEMVAVFAAAVCAEVINNHLSESYLPWDDVLSWFLVDDGQTDTAIYEERARSCVRAMPREMAWDCDPPVTNPPELGQLHIALTGGLKFIS
jgi:hypothetical protein